MEAHLVLCQLVALTLCAKDLCQDSIILEPLIDVFVARERLAFVMNNNDGAVHLIWDGQYILLFVRRKKAISQQLAAKRN